MKKAKDPLYTLFEQHLLSAIVEEESQTDFVNSVVKEFMAVMKESGVIPFTHESDLESDLKEEVLEMVRKKTYGHPNLKRFRESQSILSEKQKSAKSQSYPRKQRRIS